ncbi:MAG: nickel transporter permease [Coriobacteriales bacterium]|jgi:peptide/nickel transport system permease protein
MSEYKQSKSAVTTDDLSSLHVVHRDAGATRAPSEHVGMTPVKMRFAIASALVIVFLLIIIFGDLFIPFDAYTQDLSASKQPPSATHPFGTDEYGRDLLARVIVGGKFTVFSSLALVAIITVIGGILGAICGWFGGKVDTVIMRISDVFLAFPGMVFAIAVAGVLVGGLASAVIALACISWPKYARLVRGLVMSTKNMPYIDAARLSGKSDLTILVRDILPNIAAPIIVTSAIDIGHMIIELAGLSFLGLGAQVPTPEWGAMMSNGRSMIQLYPWIVLAPGIACFVAVTVFNLFADASRDMFDPTMRNAPRKSKRREHKDKGNARASSFSTATSQASSQ